ncbi:MAG: tetratricopeptide repeat protein [Bacteroidetes bacterium]|jgi:tetratricopeptide (TPR) repeat protein|nr:tetratricopeptide repeat protein [Bacteroidota bacterium]MBT4969939.1 tetratricopeptide repeat protein [Bacteroidota bacterium]MBT7826971.1 tetratricopeptide repeat protein [Bacteroidota bacterium]MBT7995322.1 tetratricopeptide repeat protein [Bacteroidota bacterium]
MFLSTRNISVIFLFLALSISGFGQSPKKYFKEGEKYLEERKYMLAVTKFTQALRMDQEYKDAYVFRAKAYFELGEIEKSANDYASAASYEKKNPEFAFNAGKMYYNLGSYFKAVDYLNLCTEIDKKHLDGYDYKVRALMALENYDAALFEAEKAIKIKKTAISHYNLGNVAFHLNDLETAYTNLSKAVKLDNKMKEAHFTLAKLFFKLEKSTEALTAINTAATLSPKSFDVYKLRSEIYYHRKNYVKAINDLTYILININPENADIYLLRGDYYMENNKSYNAVSDYSQVLILAPLRFDAVFKRAKAYEIIDNKEKAVQDFEDYLSRIDHNKEENRVDIYYAKTHIFELNREQNKPIIDLTWPVTKRDYLFEIPLNIDKISLKGIVRDQSALKYFKINNSEYPIDSITLSFTYSLTIANLEKVVFEAEDIYNNYQSITYTIKRTETDPPVIHLYSPFASDNGEIVLQSTNPILFVEGKVTDQSVIKSIMIDNTYASFLSTEQNPTFSAYLNISGKNEITISVIDIYDNETSINYHFNRELAKSDAENPMGKTWVVFIENSDYNQLQDLTSPAKDINLVKESLKDYNISNFIYKQNLTKSEMQRFFSIELRDLVIDNNVNSIVLWYAGHGKYTNETGYWLPVNASFADEFTYFPINSLKAAIQPYSKYLKHILVVTDACEAGPSFYMALRASPQQRDCSDWTDTRHKSAQVLTSAGNEPAVDNSKFTQTFANALLYNPDYCISIDDIVIKVNKAYEEANGQNPKFGKIAGLEDENGTFFFIKK